MIVLITGCIEEWISEQDTKRIHKYQVRPRDEQLQGWWESNPRGTYCLFFDVVRGKEVAFYYKEKDCSNTYWYTQDSILFVTCRSKGTSSYAVYYRFKGNDTLQTSRNQIQFGQRDDPNLTWNTWIRVKDQVMLDSLR